MTHSLRVTGSPNRLLTLVQAQVIKVFHPSSVGEFVVGISGQSKTHVCGLATASRYGGQMWIWNTSPILCIIRGASPSQKGISSRRFSTILSNLKNYLFKANECVICTSSFLQKHCLSLISPWQKSDSQTKMNSKSDAVRSCAISCV